MSETYKRNLEHFKERIRTAIKLHHIKVSDKYQISEKNGNKVILFNKRYLMSRYNPDKEAERIISNNLSKDKTIDKVFVLSIGNPYLIIKLLAIKEVIIIESDYELFGVVFSNWDFTQFKKQRLTIILGIEKSLLLDTIGDYISVGDRPGIIYSEPLIELNPEYYQYVLKNIKDVISFRSKNIETILQFGRIWSEQIIMNMVISKNVYSLNELINNLAKHRYNTIITGAGPSLEKGINFLKTNRNKFLLLAIDTSLPVLCSSGIIPDFVFSGDAQNLTKEHFKGYELKCDIIVAPCVYTDVLKLKWNRIFFFWYPHPFFNITEALEDETLKSGGSISISAYDFAKRIKSKNVFLLGQDYSFDPYKWYAKGTAYETRSFSEINRFSSQIKINFLENLITYNYKNREFYTMSNLLNYKNYLDYEIENTDKDTRVIDLSDGILEKPEKMGLEQAQNLLSKVKDIEIVKYEEVKRRIDTRDYVIKLYKKLIEWKELAKIDFIAAQKQNDIIDFLSFSIQDKLFELKSKIEKGVNVDKEVVNSYIIEAERWDTYLQEILNV
ncbi:MAG: 6-hydroxymethylpterin diphosphokinase MptE-like protein [Candidatus Hydrogenedentota bacterium]